MHDYQKARQKGFSLVEVLVAIAILAVVTLGIVALLPAGYTQVTNSGRVSVMSHLAQRKLDELRGLHFDQWDLTAGTHPTSPGKEWPLGTASKYSVHWEVQNCPTTAADCPSTTVAGDAKLIVVTVGYDLFTSTGTAISSSESLGQESFQVKTVIAK